MPKHHTKVDAVIRQLKAAREAIEARRSPSCVAAALHEVFVSVQDPAITAGAVRECLVAHGFRVPASSPETIELEQLSELLERCSREDTRAYARALDALWVLINNRIDELERELRADVAGDQIAQPPMPNTPPERPRITPISRPNPPTAETTAPSAAPIESTRVDL